MYEVNFPPNDQIYMNETRKFVEMEAIKPENVIRVFKPDFQKTDVIIAVGKALGHKNTTLQLEDKSKKRDLSEDQDELYDGYDLD
jgi:hypothetical protein